ncbi:urease accessory protein UreF [Endothiovibrio diazotrophicus]
MDPSTPLAALPLLRLMQLVSPSLPIGAFTWSQGLEWAVERGWVSDEASLERWLAGLLEETLTAVDLPLLARLLAAVEVGDGVALARWSDWLLAARETRELRLEERARGRALVSLLRDLGVERAVSWREPLEGCALAGFAVAAVAWSIPPREAALGYAWGWLENLVLAGVKLIPLGQTAGQRLLSRLAERLPAAVERGLAAADGEIGGSAPAAAIASSLHETQYTRLFRS